MKTIYALLVGILFVNCPAFAYTPSDLTKGNGLLRSCKKLLALNEGTELSIVEAFDGTRCGDYILNSVAKVIRLGSLVWLHNPTNALPRTYNA